MKKKTIVIMAVVLALSQDASIAAVSIFRGIERNLEDLASAGSMTSIFDGRKRDLYWKLFGFPGFRRSRVTVTDPHFKN